MAGLALQLYTVRDDVTRDGLDAVLDRVAAAGYAGVESAGMYDLAPSAFATKLADRGLRLASAHVGGPDDLDQLRAAIDAHQAAGATRVVIPAIWPDGFKDAAAVGKSAESVNRAAEVARQRGVPLGYHNHFWEIPAVDGRSALERFYDAVDPAVFAEVDIYWAQTGGIDPATLVAGLGDRAQLLHVKDGPADKPDSAMTAVGTGQVDIAGVIAAAPRAEWHIVELDRCATDMLEAVDASARFLLGTGLSEGRPAPGGASVSERG
jgi:sugar phosphate isomerase/epimerase